MIVTLTRSENAKSAIKLGYPLYSAAGSVPANAKVVRWGNGMELDRAGWSLVLNKAGVLELSTDKLAALQSLARTVKTPEIKTEGQRITEGKWVVRPHNHAEGSDFELLDAPFTVDSGCHATRFIPDTREYRVWFVRDKYLVAKRTPRTSEGQHLNDPCRSKWGYIFQDACFEKLAEEMAKARQAIPLDFGAADVLWTDSFNGGGGAWLFLEFNSAPSLDHGKVLQHFQTHLASILGPQEAPVVVRQPACAPVSLNRTPSPTAWATHVPTTGGWEAMYKAELAARVAARKAEIEREFFEGL